MTSKTSSGKRFTHFWGVFRWALGQNRGLIVLYAVLCVIGLPLIFLIAMLSTPWIWYSPSNLLYQVDENRRFLFGLFAAIVAPLTVLFSLISAGHGFRYLHHKNSMDLFHSLPVRRETLYLGRFAAGVAQIFLALFSVMAALSALILLFLHPANQVLIGEMWGHTLTLCLFVLTIYALAVFLAVCSGTTFNMILSTLLLNLLYPASFYLFSLYASSILPGLPTSALFSPWSVTAFSPIGGLIAALAWGMDLWSILWWVFLFLLFFVGGLLLYRRRKSETAEEPFSYRIPMLVLRFLASLCGGILLSYFFLLIVPNSHLLFLLGLILGALVVHLILEALYTKGFHSLLKSLPYLAASIAVLLVSYAVLGFDLFGYSRYVPRAEEVESVSISDYNTPFYMISGANILFDDELRPFPELKPILKEESSIDAFCSAHRSMNGYRQMQAFPYLPEPGDLFYSSNAIRYQMKDGSVIMREYRRTGSPVYQFFSEINHISEWVKYQTVLFWLSPSDLGQISLEEYAENGSTDQPLDLSMEQKAELQELLCADILHTSVNGITDDSPSANCSVVISSQAEMDGYNLKGKPAAPVSLEEYEGPLYFYTQSYDLSYGFPRTIAYLEQNGFLPAEEEQVQTE